ncbi:hypothetical protein HYT55_04900 [Candidatus Woesearchaeota archaeon]|nr:hypothetical protein [Candidatus Woesearchaeota archaeon]
MVTTVQISEDTLELLKKLKANTQSASYDEAIRKVVISCIREKSLGGYLGRKPSSQLLKNLRDKHDRI